jgi:hypothetical protein
MRTLRPTWAGVHFISRPGKGDGLGGNHHREDSLPAADRAGADRCPASWPANPRRISDAELDALTRSLRAFGFVPPVLARHDDHVVIGGHQRLVAARRIDLNTVPGLYLDLTTASAAPGTTSCWANC